MNYLPMIASKIQENPVLFRLVFVVVAVMAVWLSKRDDMTWLDAVKAVIASVLVSVLVEMGACLFSPGDQPSSPSDPEPIHENRSLASCKMLETSNESGSTTDVAIGDWKDSSGKKRNNSVRFWVTDKPGWSNTEYATFDISSGYERVSGIVAAEANSEENAEMYVRIYVDDIPKYTSGRITLHTPPERFEIDISGGERLTVECTTTSSSFGYSVVDANVSK